MAELTNERIREDEETLVHYVAGRLEKDNGNPDAEISEVFAEIAPRTTGRGQIGDFASSIEYSLDLEEILEEVSDWAELAAEKLVQSRFGGKERPKIAETLKKYVYGRAAAIAGYAPAHLQDIAYQLFLMLPGILGAKTKRPTGGLGGIILGLLPIEGAAAETGFKPKLGKRIGASIASLHGHANRILQQISAAKSAESKSLLAYLRRAHPDIEDYKGFMQNKKAMEVVSALDEKLSYSDALYLDEEGTKTREELGKLIRGFMDDSTRYHEMVFDERCSGMLGIIADSDGTDLELIERLNKYRQEAPEDFFKNEILEGKNPAVEALGGDYIRGSLAEDGEFYSVKSSDSDPDRRKKAFVNILSEFRSGGFGDKVYEHLARMLMAHKDPVEAAWRYAAYIGYDGGSPGCLDGMESESGKVKKAFMDALCMNAEKKAAGIVRFEAYLRQLVSMHDSEERKVAELERMTKAIKEGDRLPRIRAEPLYAQLQRMFPTADGLTLDKIFTTLDREFTKLKKTTDKTYTGVVMDFEIDGKIVYCKATTNKAMLQKEARYHDDAWKKPLMRPITPKIAGLIEEGSMAALFSYGTENLGVVPFEDQVGYFDLRKGFTMALAKKSKVNPADLEKDPAIADMFNRALSHTLMREHMDDPVYALAPLESIADASKLDSWLRSSPNAIQVVRGFAAMFPEYRRVGSEARHYDETPLILGHYDARPENIFVDSIGARPLGDFGLVKPGTPEFDLGKMENSRSDYYVNSYAFFRNSLEQHFGNDFELSGRDVAELRRRTRNVGFCNAMRIGCFKLMQGETSERYLNLARKSLELVS